MEAPGMVFPHRLLEQFEGDPQRYFERLRRVDVEDILRDYAVEIIKTSTVYVEKSVQVDDSVKALYRSMLPWLIGILTSVASHVT